MSFLENIREEILSLEDELVELRRDFHMYPELGFQEERTSAKIASYLKELGLEVREKIAHTGVTAVLKGEKGPGKCV
ncbi:MAG: Peptidase, M20D family, partial [Synergistales bacterium 53_16]